MYKVPFPPPGGNRIKLLGEKGSRREGEGKKEGKGKREEGKGKKGSVSEEGKGREERKGKRKGRQV